MAPMHIRLITSSLRLLDAGPSVINIELLHYSWEYQIVTHLVTQLWLNNAVEPGHRTDPFTQGSLKPPRLDNPVILSSFRWHHIQQVFFLEILVGQ